MNQLQQQQIDATQRPVKKAYNRPQLEIYGELREITKTVGHKAQPDNCSNPAADTCHTRA